jgi:hypothetical protein
VTAALASLGLALGSPVRQRTGQGGPRWCHHAVVACLFCLALGAASCSDPDAIELAVDLPPFDADACGTFDPPVVRANAWTTGRTNNAIHIEGNHAWVVHSGENTLGRLELDSGTFQKAFVDVGGEHNPWDFAVAPDRIYISNYSSGSVTIADRETGAVLGVVADPDLVAPSGVAVGDGQVYVASSGFEGPGYRDGAVVVFAVLAEPPYLERSAVWEVGGRNTLYLHYDGEREVLYAVSGGETVFDEDGSVAVGSDGVIDAFDGGVRREPLLLPQVKEDPVAGGPGQLVVDGDHGYLPSRTAPHIYKIDLVAWRVLRGTSDPIVAYLGEGNQLTSMAMAGPGRAYVTAFNQDSVYLFDTACDASVAGPFTVGKGDFLEGPIDIAYDPVGRRAYTLLSISNGLTEIADP